MNATAVSHPDGTAAVTLVITATAVGTREATGATATATLGGLLATVGRVQLSVVVHAGVPLLVGEIRAGTPRRLSAVHAAQPVPA